MPVLEKQETKILLASERQALDAKKNADNKEKYSTEDAVGVYQKTKSGTMLEKPQSRSKSNVSQSQPKVGKSKDYVLNKREASMYISIKKTYANDTWRKQRENRFYQKLIEVQLEEWRQSHQHYAMRKFKKMESKYRQQLQLQELRNRFTEEQEARFKNQYITGKVLEHEWENRHIYGLPEDMNSEPKTAAKIKDRDKKPSEIFKIQEHQQRNQQKFSKLFKSPGKSVWASEKDPKMVNVDVVELQDKTNNKGKFNF